MEMMMAVMTRMVLVMEMVMVLVMEMATKLSKHYSPSLRPLPVWVVVAKGAFQVIYFKDVFQSNSWYYMIGSNGHWAQSSCNISGASHHGVVLLLALLKVINQVSSFKNFREK